MTHARGRGDTNTVLLLFIFASTPAMLVGAWRAGQQMLVQKAAGSDWRWQWLHASGLSISEDEWLSCFVLGLAHILPLLAVAVLVSLFWALVFARYRGRAVDPGWAMVAWIYVLLLPVDLSPLLAAVGMTFAAVLGQHIFGGTGRYIVSPAALGALFVQFSYPGAGEVSSVESWVAVAASGAAGDATASLPAMIAAASSFGAFPMALACALGVAILARAGIISLRTVLGGVLGIAMLATLAASIGDSPIATLAWYWHLALGSLPICLAFVITDPTTLPLSRGGRWLHGMLFALFVMAIRVLDPTHPDGSMFAVLLATLSVPLIDYFVLQRHVARAAGRLELRV
jgi:Na+-transporting NADH:ubiquinone oxidoreductase subunit B